MAVLKLNTAVPLLLQCVWGVLVLKVYGTHDCILVIINVLIMPFMTR